MTGFGSAFLILTIIVVAVRFISSYGIGACENDLGFWSKDGFDTYSDNLRRCSVLFSSIKTKPQNIDTLSCCMQGKSAKGLICDGVSPEYNAPEPFSPGCATCFGAFIYCVEVNCDVDCLPPNNLDDCGSCREKNCMPSFRKCSGIDIRCRAGKNCIAPDPPLSMVEIVAISLGITISVVLTILGIFWYYRRKGAPKELESLKEQIKEIRKRKAQIIVTEEANVENSLDIPLIAKYSFDKEEDDEVSIAQGDHATGIKIIDGEWWLIRKLNKEVGLVPKSFMDEQITPQQD